jgi:hypothetical protein
MKDFFHVLAKRIIKNTTTFENYKRVFVLEGQPLDRWREGVGTERNGQEREETAWWSTKFLSDMQERRKR